MGFAGLMYGDSLGCMVDLRAAVVSCDHNGVAMYRAAMSVISSDVAAEVPTILVPCEFRRCCAAIVSVRLPVLASWLSKMRSLSSDVWLWLYHGRQLLLAGLQCWVKRLYRFI